MMKLYYIYRTRIGKLLSKGSRKFFFKLLDQISGHRVLDLYIPVQSLKQYFLLLLNKTLEVHEVSNLDLGNGMKNKT